VEKRSFSWRYPSEINELAAFAPPAEPTLERAMEQGSYAKVITAGGSQASIAAQAVNPVLAPEAPSAEQLVDEEINTPVKSIKHIVAFKPHIDNIDIKTIKSTQQPKMVKVEVREKEKINTTIPRESVVRSAELLYDHTLTEIKQAPLYEAAQPISQQQSVFDQPASTPVLQQSTSTSNRLEIVVLLVGAISILAVAYLLLTSNY